MDRRCRTSGRRIRVCGRCRCSRTSRRSWGCRRWSAAGDFLLGFLGTQFGLADVVRGPHAGVGGESQDVGFMVAQNSACPCRDAVRLFLGPGMRGTLASATVMARRTAARGVRGWRRGRVQALVAGLVVAWISLRSASCAGRARSFRGRFPRSCRSRTGAGRRPGGRRCSSTSRGSSCRTGR